MRTLEGLASWQVYFYRGNGWTNAQSSGDLAQPSAPKAPPAAASAAPGAASGTVAAPRQLLPSGVRLVLEFADGGASTGNLTRDTMLGP